MHTKQFTKYLSIVLSPAPVCMSPIMSGVTRLSYMYTCILEHVPSSRSFSQTHFLAFVADTVLNKKSNHPKRMRAFA